MRIQVLSKKLRTVIADAPSKQKGPETLALVRPDQFACKNVHDFPRVVMLYGGYGKSIPCLYF
jgi:hypothetical protein